MAEEPYNLLNYIALGAKGSHCGSLKCFLKYGY